MCRLKRNIRVKSLKMRLVVLRHCLRGVHFRFSSLLQDKKFDIRIVLDHLDISELLCLG